MVQLLTHLTRLAHPNELKFVAVAEPDPVRRAQFAEAHAIPPERQFATWEEVIAQPKMADVVFNCTQDQMHSRLWHGGAESRLQYAPGKANGEHPG